MAPKKKILTKAFTSRIVANVSDVLTEMTETEVSALVSELDDLYYNKGKTPLSDDMYDIIKAHLKKLNPKNAVAKKVGAPIKGVKEKLPFYMGSMDKIKSENTSLDNFRTRYPGVWVLSDKLDGNSALLHVRDGKAKLFSRGNGIEGQNISHLLPLIRGIPCEIMSPSYSKDVTVRGELIISKDDFDVVSDQGANARNMVAGLVNAKRPNEDLVRRVQFVAYTLITPGPLKISEQMEWLYTQGFTTVYNDSLKAQECSFDKLSEILVKRRAASPFEIDGIIVAHDASYKVESGKNPTYAFAFKNLITQDTSEVVVTNVEWNISKDGYLKPVVEFEGVKLSGVVIKRATGFNGEYIHSNKIGPGARIVITRSGEVIPYILRIEAPAKEPQMPDVSFEWTESGKEIIVKGANTEVDFKQVENFFTKIKVRGLSSATIRKLYDSGLDSPNAILNAPLNALTSVIGVKNGEKIAKGITEVKADIDCVMLMDASNMFGRGFGERKLRAIVDAFPQIMNGKFTPTKGDLITVEGVSNITAEKFIFGLQRYRMFINESKIDCKSGPSSPKSPKSPPAKNEGKERNLKQKKDMEGQIVLFTGFRNKELGSEVTKRGGKMVETFSKKVTILVTKDEDSGSTKVKKANELGTVKILTLDEFTSMLG